MLCRLAGPARALLTGFRVAADTNRFTSFGVAFLASTLGLRDEALPTLDRLRATPSRFRPECAPGVPCSAGLDVWVAIQHPGYVPLRGEPRFQRLLEETRPRVPWLEGRGP